MGALSIAAIGCGRRYPFQAGEVCCQKTSLSWVDSVAEILCPLLRGVPLVLIPDEEVKDPARLVDILARHSVTRLVLVPSLLRALLDTCVDLQERLPKLWLWSTSGEPLPISTAGHFREALPACTLLNLYGTSEVSADATWYEVRPDDSHLPSVPIGRPISNTRIYILDGTMQPVPQASRANSAWAGTAWLADIICAPT